jgi:hypothetical protein
MKEIIYDVIEFTRAILGVMFISYLFWGGFIIG